MRDYLRRCKIIQKEEKLLIFSSSIYILSFLLGSLSSIRILGNSICERTFQLNPVNFMWILKTNLTAILQLLAGSVLFGLSTFLSLCLNGLYTGYAVTFTLENRLSYNEIMILTLPHGILEIPAMIIAGAAGFKIPYEITKYLAGKKENVLTKQDIKEYLTLASISIILIVIAAWIEANITLRIAESILSSGG